MARIGRHVRVSGRVQGVFFRAWTKQQAAELGVAGWVRNSVDGSVEAELSGEEGAVAELVERLREGPPSAAVSNVEVTRIDPGSDQGFFVRH